MDDLNPALVKLVFNNPKAKKVIKLRLKEVLLITNVLQTPDILKSFCDVLEQKLINPQPLKTLKTNLNEQSEDCQEQLWVYHYLKKQLMIYWIA